MNRSSKMNMNPSNVSYHKLVLPGVLSTVKAQNFKFHLQQSVIRLRMRVSAPYLSAIGIGLALLFPGRCSADTGLQAIGFANWKAEDVLATSQIYRNVGGNLELTFLPFEFNPSHPFDNASSFARQVLPGSGVQLRLTVFLLFRNDHQFVIPADYEVRIHQTDVWITQMRAWAAQNGFGNRLGITVCPFLEDTGTYSQYSGLLNRVATQQARDGISTAFRRSPINSAISFRVGSIPDEYHGTDMSRFRFHPYDRWSNDGDEVGQEVSLTSLQTILKNLPGSVSPLFWDNSFNGRDIYPSTTPPSARRNLSPFGGSATSPLGRLATQILSYR